MAVRASGFSASSASSGQSSITASPGKRVSCAKAGRGSIKAHVVARHPRHRQERLRDVHGPHDDHPQGGLWTWTKVAPSSSIPDRSARKRSAQGSGPSIRRSPVAVFTT
jgi:hypothetical protein